MANLQSTVVSGTLNVTGSSTFASISGTTAQFEQLTGTLFGTSSYATNAATLDGTSPANFAVLNSSNNFTSTNTFTIITGTNVQITNDLFVYGTASIAQLNTLNQTSLVIGDKYITILSGAVDHSTLDGSGILWGSGTIDVTQDELGANAHVRFDGTKDKIRIFPGLFVSGGTGIELADNLTVTGSSTLTTVSGTTAQFTVVSASVISASSYVGISSGDVNSTANNTFTGINTFNTNFITASAGITGSIAKFTEITSSGMYITGNLGINTSPSSNSIVLKMHGNPVLDGDNRVLLEVIDKTTMAAGVGAGFTFGGNFTDAGDAAGWAGIKGIKENGTTNNLDASLVFMTRKQGVGSIAEKMRIDSNGNVGIATASPNYTLSVTGTLGVSGNSNVSTISGTTAEFTTITASNMLLGGQPVAAATSSFLVLTASTNLTNERVLTAGTNVTFTDTGGGGTLTVSVPDLWTYVVLAGDFTTTSATSVSVTNLFFTPEANKRYEIYGQLLLRTSAAATGARPGVNPITTGVTENAYYIDAPNSTTALAIQTQGVTTAGLNAASTGLPTTNNSYLSTLIATLITTAGATGNYQVTLASETNGTSVTMKAGSFIRYRTF